MIKTRIAIIIATAMIGVIVNSAAIPKTHAGGGIISLVANGAQDVYLTQNDTAKLQYDKNKLKSDITELQAEESKSQSSGLYNIVSSASQDVDELQSDITKLQSDEDKLKSDITELQAEESK